ncbi:hypothetical protein CMEL01_08161 [Colletotrichum melonis]|uniref:Uncharacterized protein n=1 Tax=Colletotrichum melonis TaxID=1209925 RepID=A0AAI9XID6_9PEZI|nr:hypothetical protein CMEL01_08161 [Colletotrichum melonis]
MKLFCDGLANVSRERRKVEQWELHFRWRMPFFLEAAG